MNVREFVFKHVKYVPETESMNMENKHGMKKKVSSQ